MTDSSVRERILADNEVTADQLRARFRDQGTLVVNFISSPGAGKTTLLEATIERLRERLRIGAIEGDIAT
ncbi:MAG TPA: GTP-binding protein, partial [Vicinamibacteria bacterium]